MDGTGQVEREPSRQITTSLSSEVESDVIYLDGEEAVVWRAGEWGLRD